MDTEHITMMLRAMMDMAAAAQTQVKHSGEMMNQMKESRAHSLSRDDSTASGTGDVKRSTWGHKEYDTRAGTGIKVTLDMGIQLKTGLSGTSSGAMRSRTS